MPSTTHKPVIIRDTPRENDSFTAGSDQPYQTGLLFLIQNLDRKEKQSIDPETLSAQS